MTKEAVEMSWEWLKSKRFVLALPVLLFWLVSGVVALAGGTEEVFKFCTPWCLGSIGLWQGWDTVGKRLSQ